MQNRISQLETELYSDPSQKALLNLWENGYQPLLAFRLRSVIQEPSAENRQAYINCLGEFAYKLTDIHLAMSPESRAAAPGRDFVELAETRIPAEVTKFIRQFDGIFAQRPAVESKEEVQPNASAKLSWLSGVLERNSWVLDYLKALGSLPGAKQIVAAASYLVSSISSWLSGPTTTQKQPEETVKITPSAQLSSAQIEKLIGGLQDWDAYLNKECAPSKQSKPT